MHKKGDIAERATEKGSLLQDTDMQEIHYIESRLAVVELQYGKMQSQ